MPQVQLICKYTWETSWLKIYFNWFRLTSRKCPHKATNLYRWTDRHKDRCVSQHHCMFTWISILSDRRPRDKKHWWGQYQTVGSVLRVTNSFLVDWSHFRQLLPVQYKHWHIFCPVSGQCPDSYCTLYLRSKTRSKGLSLFLYIFFLLKPLHKFLKIISGAE